MQNTNNRPAKLLRNNKLDKDVQSIVQPFNIMLSVLFSSKYKIKDSYITACDKIYPIMIFFVVTVGNLICLNVEFKNNITYYIPEGNAYPYTYLTVISSYLLVYWMSYMTLIICNIVQSRCNVALILSIQEIHRYIDISKNLRSFIIGNWISLLTVISVSIVIIASYHAVFEKITFVDISCNLIIVAFDINLVYSVRLMTLLTKYLNEWVKNTFKVTKEEENKDYYKNLFVIYQNILEAYTLLTQCFKVLILCRIIDAFLRCLCLVELHLLDLQNTRISKEQVIMSLCTIGAGWIWKNIALVVITSAQCEKFYISVEEAESACIQLMMDTNCPKSHKYLCKRVLQANRIFSKMTACGLFTIDASLPIPLMRLTYSYIIVLLQFNVL